MVYPSRRQSGDKPVLDWFTGSASDRVDGGLLVLMRMKKVVVQGSAEPEGLWDFQKSRLKKLKC